MSTTKIVPAFNPHQSEFAQASHLFMTKVRGGGVKKSEVVELSPEARSQLANKVTHEQRHANQFRIALQHGRDAHPSALQPAAK
jgi:hypothetical protein